MQNRDRKIVAAFNDSPLSPAFSKLAKPAKCALVNNKIYAARDLAQWTLHDVAEFHGIGPSAIPILREALRKSGLKFKKIMQQA